MTDLAFTDCETTSLRPDRRAWEIAIIRRGPGNRDRERRIHLFIDVHDLDLANADVQSLQIGGFYDRHPQMAAAVAREADTARTVSEATAMRIIEKETRGAHLVGNVVNFDAETYAARMRAHGLCPAWHYHLIDVEALAVGALASGTCPQLPWDSDELSLRLGATVAAQERHTAMGDTIWAMRMYDAVINPRQTSMDSREA